MLLYFFAHPLVVNARPADDDKGDGEESTCDASDLLPNAEDVGDCTATLKAGTTCTNTGSEGFICTASNCNLVASFIPGWCRGNGAVIISVFRLWGSE
jgi:hypothetical protein